jgi:hypothetical protein
MKSDQSRELSSASSLKRRFAYSLAASAAAASHGPEASAAVVYSGLQSYSIPQTDDFQINFNGDGFNDIDLDNYAFTPLPPNYPGGNYQGSYAYSGRLFAFFTNSRVYTTALSAGTLISGAGISGYFDASMAYGANNPNAQFNDVENAFIGLSFFALSQSPNPFYAWVRVAVDNAAGAFVVKDWAYESVAGTGILAGDTGSGFVPEPGSLGLLAAGSVGLAALRRKRERVAA